MRRKLLNLLLFAMLFSSASMAQSTMRVVLKDGTYTNYEISTLQELLFMGQATWKVTIPDEFEGGTVYLVETDEDGNTTDYEMTKNGDTYTTRHESTIGDSYSYKIKYNDVIYTDTEEYTVTDNFIMNDDASDDEFLEGLKINTRSIMLEAGNSETLTVTWQTKKVVPVWATSNKNIATVTATGIVTGKNKGTATVTATYKGQTQTCDVQVGSSDPRTSGSNYFVFYMDDETYSLIEDQVAGDYRINETTVFMDIYEESYKSKECSGLNAYGQEVDWMHFEVKNALWNAGSGGFRVKDDINLGFVDGSYNLHIDYKSSDNARSSICLYNVATNEEFWIVLPTTDDGEWHSFDKSIIDLGLTAEWFNNYTYTSGNGRNVIAFKTEGMGLDLEWCAIYLYQHGGFVINQKSVALKVGETSSAKVYKDGEEVVPAWSSNNLKVATVDAAGTITAVGAGTATISAIYEGEVAECTVTVKEQDPRLIGYNYYVLLMDDDTYQDIEENVKYDYRVNDSERVFDIWSDSYAEGTCVGKNAYDKEETWLSLVAQENPWEGIGGGGIRSMADVNLSEINESYRLHIDYKSSDGALNQIALFNMSDHTKTWIDVYEGVTDGEWHSFDKSIKEMKLPLTMFNDYTYTSGDGEYIIGMQTIGTDKQLDWCSIFFYQPAGLILNTNNISLETGDTDKLTAYYNGEEITPVWSSSNTAVASVDASGNITTTGVGTAEITATYEGSSVKCNVKVIKSDARLKGSNYYVFMMDDVTYAKIEDNVDQDFRVDDSKKFLYIWENSYAEGECEGENAYDQELDWASLIAQASPWEGVGAGAIFVNDDISMSGIAGSDYADYYLHVDYKLTAGATKQEILLYNVASSKTDPAATVELPTNKGNDGWYSFEASLSSLGVSKNIFKDFTYTKTGKNVIGLRTTGADKQFDVCGLYIYKPSK